MQEKQNNKIDTNTEFKLSTQAIATLMVTLQKCLIEQSDITKMLRSYKFSHSEEGELVVDNPPSNLTVNFVEGVE